MALSEIVTLLIWAFGILNVVEPLPSFIGLIGSAIFWLLLITHLIEIIYFSKTIKNSEDGLFKGSLLTLLFGIFYIKSIER
jgi:uncharacterized protein YhhL (DUF1145 family)